ncbi:MAG TPA: hypothetical protein VD931_22205 [Baekduia sp.]|nr:hypothetical protein [Baekduia sp.]
MLEHGATLAVSIGFSVFSPAHADVLVGDTVRWTNDSVRVHTVTARDESFDSGRIPQGDVYQRRFEVPGVVPYFCRLHPIPGEVEAHRLLLEDPGPAGGSGRARVLRGRAALTAGTPVALEADSGAGFAPVATAAAGEHGDVRFDVAPRRTTAYRLTAGGEASRPRTVEVLDRRVAVSTTRGRRRTVVRAAVAPAAPGTDVVLQVRLPERFGWWPVARARLDRDSKARWRIPAGRRRSARVVLTARDGASVLATSRTFFVGRRVAPAGAPRRSGAHAGH